MTRTASGGIVIVRRYAGGANDDHEVSGTFGTDAGIAGVTAPSPVPPDRFRSRASRAGSHAGTAGTHRDRPHER